MSMGISFYFAGVIQELVVIVGGSSPSLQALLVSARRFLRHGEGAHGWVAGIASHVSAFTVLVLAGHSGGLWTSQAPIVHTAVCSC